MAQLSTAQKIRVLEQHGITENAAIIIQAFAIVGPAMREGFDLAACCAIVVNESNGRNVWGDDPWNRDIYPDGIALDPEWGLNDQPVTQADYTRYKLRRDAGMQPQGVGPTQITDASLQIDAEHIGGCWVPLHSTNVGFRFIKDLFILHGSPLEAFGAYNGGGPDSQYARDAVVLQHEFHVALNP